MLVSDTHRFLFVHVQKTGGVSMEHLLKPQLPDVRTLPGVPRHAKLDRILATEPALADYWTVGFVRNPWARLVSWYQMIQRFKVLADQGAPKAQAFLKGKGFMAAVARDHPDFESFVLRGSEDWARLRTPQLSYLQAGDRTADFIGRTESYDEAVRTVLTRLGLDAGSEIPRSNSAPPRDYRTEYTPASRDRVAELFRVDVETFGYTY